MVLRLFSRTKLRTISDRNIIDSYCCNENEEQNLIRQACLRVSFFKNINNNQLLDFYVVCYGLNEYLGLGVKDLVVSRILRKLVCRSWYK